MLFELHHDCCIIEGLNQTYQGVAFREAQLASVHVCDSAKDNCLNRVNEHVK